jgi:hypothetical protein
MSRKPLIIAASIIALVAPAVAIAGPSISTQAAPGVNFGAYHTYTWVQASLPESGNAVLEQQIISDFDAALSQRGFRQVQSGGEISLMLTIGAREKTEYQSWGWWGLQTSVYQYTQGQLSLDVFDTKSERAIWHGQASETIDPDRPNPSRIDAAVTKLMAQFPATATPPTLR